MRLRLNLYRGQSGRINYLPSDIKQGKESYASSVACVAGSPVTISTYWLLVLNSYGSYINPKFDQFCLNYQIIIICMLAYLLYLLQLLDVGCFLIFKQVYKCSVKQIMYCSVNYINKHEFLLLYIQARQLVLYQNNIQAGFTAIKLILYSPNCVLGLLYAEYQILLPQYSL